MHHADPGVVCDGEALEQPIEHTVEDHVPGQGQAGDEDGDHAHFQHRFLHDPGQQWGTDQDGQQFEADGLKNTFSNGFVGAHGRTPLSDCGCHDLSSHRYFITNNHRSRR
ncbi:hypothetical protein D3C71_1688260 [compost metagenome]